MSVLAFRIFSVLVFIKVGANLKVVESNFDFFLLAEKADTIKIEAHNTFNLISDWAMGYYNRTSNILEAVSLYSNISITTLDELRTTTSEFLESTKNQSMEIIENIENILENNRLQENTRNDIKNYLTELEEFNLIFDETVDDAFSILTDFLRDLENRIISARVNFEDLLTNRDIKFDSKPWCYINYSKFKKNSMKKMFNCLQESMPTFYNIFSITKQELIGTIKILEMKSEQIRNCIKFNNFQFACNFVSNYENQFSALEVKLRELLIYNGQQKIRAPNLDLCLSYGFPSNEMSSELKSCFYFFQLINS